MSFEWLKDCMQSVNPLKDYECNPWKDWRITMILQPFEESRLQSLEVWKDHTHGPSKRWGITRNPSKGWRIACVVFRRVEGLCAILHPFQGLQMQSLEGLKGCIHSPSKGWGITCNPLKGWRVALIDLRRVEELRVVLQPFQVLWVWSFNP